MTDLSSTIIAKSDQLNADDLINRQITIKITKVSGRESEQPIAINYEGDEGKPYYPCKSMRRVLCHVWGTNGNAYVGRQLTLYRDDRVKFGGLEVGGIRISHMSHIDKPVTMALTASKANKKPFTVKPLAVTVAAEPDPALIAAGNAAAATGVEGYKTWLATLTDDQKTTVRSRHKDWSSEAKRVDEAAKPAPEQPDELPA